LIFERTYVCLKDGVRYCRHRFGRSILEVKTNQMVISFVGTNGKLNPMKWHREFYFVGGGGDVALASALSAENINCIEYDETSTLNSISKIKINYDVHGKHICPTNRQCALSGLSSAAVGKGYTAHHSRKNLT